MITTSVIFLSFSITYRVYAFFWLCNFIFKYFTSRIRTKLTGMVLLGIFCLVKDRVHQNNKKITTRNSNFRSVVIQCSKASNTTWTSGFTIMEVIEKLVPIIMHNVCMHGILRPWFLFCLANLLNLCLNLLL